MSVLVFVDTSNGVNKAALEASFYGSKVAGMIGGSTTVVTFGNEGALADLGKAGANKVVAARNIQHADPQQLCRLISAVADQEGASVIVIPQDPVGKAVAPRVAAKLKAGNASPAIALPDTSNGFVVKTNVFSGKAFANVNITSDKKVISLLPNSLQPELGDGSASVEDFSGDVGNAGIQFKDLKSQGGSVPLPEAELVVSAGRGLKGPENWGIVEDLANSLDAATACSRPVADIGWRPHHEHVGQTGVAIRPNLYIAAGISGAIQHLAGVNGSKTIVVINTDAEAPFFKAADYGVVGDAFEVLPRLTEAVKKFKASN